MRRKEEPKKYNPLELDWAIMQDMMLKRKELWHKMINEKVEEQKKRDRVNLIIFIVLMIIAIGYVGSRVMVAKIEGRF